MADNIIAITFNNDKITSNDTSDSIYLSGTIYVDYTSNNVSGSIDVKGAFEVTLSDFIFRDSRGAIYIASNPDENTQFLIKYPDTNQSPSTVTANYADFSTDFNWYNPSAPVSSAAYTPDTPCYVTGTQILTSRGEVAVEALAVGDLVVTASGEYRPIRWIGHRTVDCRVGWQPEKTRPIRLCAGALAPGLPRRDLLVSPDHAFFFDDVLITAQTLVNGSTVKQVEADTITYYGIELDSHDVILAEGVAAETYFDDGQRNRFDNYEGDGSDLDPSRALTREGSFRPLITRGPRAAEVRFWIDTRARQLGLSPAYGHAGLAENQAASVQSIDAAGEPLIVEGRLEHVSREEIRGWAWMPDQPATPVELELILDGEVALMFAADLFRPDLLFAKKGLGRHAFRVRLPPRAYARIWTHVAVRVRSTGLHLIHAQGAVAAEDAQDLVLA